jgi:L-cystine uptake protein TcyP (sodium:dicarboxylate symporter family)
MAQTRRHLLSVVKLLQMTVLPFITLSIINSLGELSYQQVTTFGLRGGPVVVL